MEAIAAAQTSASPALPVLIGREHETKLLVQALGDGSALVLVEGDDGAGKTTLVRTALADRAARTGVLTGHCQHLREPFLLGPVVEALCDVCRRPPTRSLGPVAGALNALVPELAGLLPPRPAALDDPRDERHRIFRAVRELLGALDRTICVLEDLHWADESTLELLSFLVADPPPQLSLVVTYCAEDLPPASPLPGLATALAPGASGLTIRVPALSVDEVGRLAGVLLGTGSVPADLARHLHDQTAGLPFAVEEVVRAHRGQLELVDEWRTVDDLDHMGVPVSVRQSLRARTASLTDDARLVAGAAAVLGAPAPEPLIGAVAGIPPARTTTALSRAVADAVLRERPDGRYGFRHALAAQAVYDEIPRPERQRLHRRAAEALESGPRPLPLGQLAHHFAAADRPRQGAHYAEAAGDAAASGGDGRSAARLFERALGAAGLPPATRLRIAGKLGSVALHSTDPRRAIALLERVRDQEDAPVAVRGELRYRVARLRSQTGDTGPWRDEMELAVTELAERPDLAAHAMVALAWPNVGQQDAGAGLAWLDRAADAASRTAGSAIPAFVAAQRAAILMCVGDRRAWSAAQAIPAAGPSRGERLERLAAFQSLAQTAIALGHFARAETFLAEVGRLVDELPHVAWTPWLDSARASLDWRMGRWGGLEQRLRASSRRVAGNPALAMGDEIILTALVLCGGRVADAQRRYESIRERAVPRGWTGSRLAAAAGLAQIRLALEDPAGAVAASADGLEVLERKGVWIWGQTLVPVAVRARLACGDLEGASALTQRFSAGVHGRDAPAARAARLACEGSIADAEGRHASAAGHFARAERILSRLPAPYEAARVRAARGRCLLAADVAEGVDLLLNALGVFDRLGAAWDGGQIRAELRGRGVRVGSRRGGRRPYGDQLSPREAQIAELAASGRKNREIAKELFISQRTVESHVAAARRKLGAESRGALASAMASGAGAGARGR